jgi:hypothetical protein
MGCCSFFEFAAALFGELHNLHVSIIIWALAHPQTITLQTLDQSGGFTICDHGSL